MTIAELRALYADNLEAYYDFMDNILEQRHQEALKNPTVALQRKFLAYYFDITDGGMMDGWIAPSAKRDDKTEYRFNVQYVPEGVYPCGSVVGLLGADIANIGEEDWTKWQHFISEEEDKRAIKAMIAEVENKYPEYNDAVAERIADCIVEFDSTYFGRYHTKEYDSIEYNLITEGM